MAVMAVMNDPGTEGTNFEVLVPAMTQAALKLLTGGFGDYGFYAEGHGPSHVSSDTGFVPMLQAWRTCLGKDFITPRPNAQWISLRWVMETVPIKGRPMYLNRQKAQGSYGDDYFWRSGWSHGGQKITLAKDGLTFAVTTKPAVPAVGKPPVLPPNTDVPKTSAGGAMDE